MSTYGSTVNVNMQPKSDLGLYTFRHVQW